MRTLGDVFVVAPLREQSGVAHAITFMVPLQVRTVYVNGVPWAWAVDGTPADCVKVAIASILEEPPDLIVSGINGGHNAGINVYYSGTVGAAAEGAFYGITSVAVSLQHHENAPYDQAADIAVDIIRKILSQNRKQNNLPGQLYNINIPLKALKNDAPEVKIVPVDQSHYWESYERRTDTMNRPYHWLSGRPDPRQPKHDAPEYLTDFTAFSEGYITVTPLKYDVTDRQRLQEMSGWDLNPVQCSESDAEYNAAHTGPKVRVSWR